MKSAIKHIEKEGKSLLKYGLSKHFEIKRISKLDRYKTFYTKILNKQIGCHDSKSFIGQYREIFEREIYKFETPDDEPYIIDCGANIGLSTIYLKLKFPCAKVVAFEPDPLVYKLLCKNIESFNLGNVVLINKGVASANDKVHFFGKGDVGGRIVSEEAQGKCIEIDTVSLKGYLDQKVHLLKIDIEGAEYEVMEDIKGHLSGVERIFIEYHSNIKQAQRLDSILKILKDSGFRYFIENTTIKGKHPFTEDFKGIKYDNLVNIFGYCPPAQNFK